MQQVSTSHPTEQRVSLAVQFQQNQEAGTALSTSQPPRMFPGADPILPPQPVQAASPRAGLKE